ADPGSRNSRKESKMKIRSAPVVLLAGLILLGLAGRGVGQQPAPPIPAVVLEDQFEQRQDVAAHRGGIVVLIYGGRRSADLNKQWGELVHVHFHPSAKGQPPAWARQAPVRPVPGQPAGTRTPDVLAVPVACVGKVPAMVRRIIRSQVRSASPDLPVWL